MGRDLDYRIKAQNGTDKIESVWAQGAHNPWNKNKSTKPHSWKHRLPRLSILEFKGDIYTCFAG